MKLLENNKTDIHYRGILNSSAIKGKVFDKLHQSFNEEIPINTILTRDEKTTNCLNFIGYKDKRITEEHLDKGGNQDDIWLYIYYPLDKNDIKPPNTTGKEIFNPIPREHPDLETNDSNEVYCFDSHIESNSKKLLENISKEFNDILLKHGIKNGNITIRKKHTY